MKTQSCARYARLATAALTVLATGCAALNTTPQPRVAGAAPPPPMVQNCGVISVGTPSRFVCNGKVYTSFQLAKMREDEAKKYASGK